jgi:tetratricopeptide (TPR) repeat protein
VYPTDAVGQFLEGSFVTARLNVEDEKALAQRYNATWTPNLLFLDGNETVHYRIVPGSLPAAAFLPAVKIGLGKFRFDLQKYDEAIKCFDEVLEKHSGSLSAPQALYWRGVCYYKKGDKERLVDSWKTIRKDYPDSFWSKAVTFLQ